MSLIRKTLPIICFVTIAISHLTYSQVSTSVFERTTSKDGLSQSTVHYIIQDKNGFLWFGTNGGLNRYDGYSFTVYEHDGEDSTSISHDQIIWLCEDQKGCIWTVGIGLNKFDPVTQSFTRYTHDPSDSTSISSNITYCIMKDKQGNIWLCNDNALNLVVEKTQNNKTVTSFQRFFPKLDKEFFYIYENKKDQLLLFADSLYYFDRETKAFNNAGVGLAKSFVISVAEDKFGNIFLGTHEDGIIKLEYNAANSTYKKVEAGKINVTPKSRNVLHIDIYGRLWIGTDAKGLYRYDPDKDQLINYLPDELDNKSISDNTIYSFFTDYSGVLWIGTFSQGLCKYDLYRKKFEHFKSIPGNPNSLAGNVISSIHSIDPNELWVGLDLDGGVEHIIFDKNQKPQFINYKHNPGNENSIAANSTLSLVQRRNGEVWIGGASNSVSRIIPERPGTEKLPKIKRYAVKGWTFVLYEDSEGTLWGGTWNCGFWRFDDNSNEFTYFMPDANDPSSVCDNVIWAIGEDKYKNIWIGGHSKGLSILPYGEKYKPKPGFINIGYRKDNPLSLSNNTINSFCLDHTGTMWVATDGGLNKVIDENALKNLDENSNPQFLTYRKKNGLPSDRIIGIVEDKDENIWLSTSNGICRFNVADTTFTNYYEIDGLQSNEFWHNAYFINSQGKIFFGGPNGFNAFYPAEIEPNPIKPKVVLTGLKIFNQPVKVGQKIEDNIVLTKPIYETSSIQLTYKSNMVTFEFAALHYTFPLKNQYAYKMEGFDKNWNYVENNRMATYTNLEPGEYTFRVKASNNDGVWNEEGTRIKITILPPWWQTTLARVIFVLLILGLFLGIYFYRVNQLKIQKKVLEKVVKERTKKLNIQASQLSEVNTQLEEKNEEIQISSETLTEANILLRERTEELSVLNTTKDKLFSIIAHDLKSPFGSIIGLTDLLVQRFNKFNENKKMEMLQVINESSKNHYKLLENLLQWARSQTGKIRFHPVKMLLNEMINTNISLVENMAREKNIDLKKNFNKAIPVFADKNMLDTVIRNLLSNAIKFTEEGTITIDVDQKKGQTTVTITDTGVGIDGAKTDKIFDVMHSKSTSGTKGEPGTGLGLILCKEFIEKHNGTISAKSELGKGSTFSFTIPNK